MYNKVKRVIDFCISLIILPIVLLLLVVVGIAIKLEDRGPIFYMGERIGYHGKIFKKFKFRSMKVNALDLRYADGSTYNSEDDPRVTKVGRFLRKTSIEGVDIIGQPTEALILKGVRLISPNHTVVNANWKTARMPITA